MDKMWQFMKPYKEHLMQNVLTKTAAVLAAALLAAAMAAGCGSGSAVKQQLDPRDDTQKR